MKYPLINLNYIQLDVSLIETLKIYYTVIHYIIVISFFLKKRKFRAKAQTFTKKNKIINKKIATIWRRF